MTCLELRGVGKRYGTVQALDGLDVDVAAGSLTAVVGPSGSGKTTLLRLIAGFEAPDSGTITLTGEPLADAEFGVPAHLRRVGLVMQEGALFPHLSVLDNIRFGIRQEPDSAERALALMDLVELERSMAARQPHQLSGGQQQRVALARALARKPRLMLLDEPFSALDAGLREQVRRATAAILAKAGVTTLLVTHDRDEAMSIADQLILLRQGRLVQAGQPRDLYLRPADAAAASFLGPAIILDADIRDGVAHTALGALALPQGERTAGTARVLIRPEQLRLSAAPNGEDALPGVVSVKFVGPTARIVLDVPSGNGTQRLAFETTSRDLPEAGSAVSVGVSGEVHRLP